MGSPVLADAHGADDGQHGIHDPEQNAESFTKLQSDVADMKGNATNAALSSQDDQKRLGAVEALLGRFRWSGDVRVRGESFFQNYSGCVACVDRNRARIRLRLGFEG